jgi:His/Glu/Gln/Arg/opine family amino acid ABC transporter permease subunit
VRWDVVATNAPYLLEGLRGTVVLGLLVMALGTALGFGVGLARLGRGVVYACATAFVELFRDTPLIMQIFFIFFGLPALGIRLNPFVAAAAAMTFFAAANAAEIVRGAIQSIPRGQWEAACSLGLTPVQSLRWVVLPQALRRMLPPMMGLFTTLLKDTSLAAIVNVFELTTAGRRVVERTLASFEIWLVVAALYFLVCYPLSVATQRLERRLVGEGA